MTAPYSVGDVVEVEWRRRMWAEGEVIQQAPNSDAVCVLTVHGKRWVAPGELRAPASARQSLKLSVPEVSEEADSFESARERSPGSVKAELHAVPKAPKPFRSRAHLKSVAEGGCCVPLCTAPASAHHMENEGGSKKCDDRLTAPLCDVHHLDWWHKKGHLPGLDRTGSLALMWEACARGLAMKTEAGR